MGDADVARHFDVDVRPEGLGGAIHEDVETTEFAGAHGGYSIKHINSIISIVGRAL